MDILDKRALYGDFLRDLDAVLAGITDDVTAMATCACLLHERLPYASWTGFYRVVAPELLRVGPYQGPLGCLEIPFARGVCGAAARSRSTQLVPDVHRFPGHVACDPGARSEIVVPVCDVTGELIAVLDVDSHQLAAFDEDDRDGLERIAGRLRTYLASGRTAAPAIEGKPAAGDSADTGR
ncbi:MAG TPA: GAF domain-containing protein [Thermoanaerobaculia bacterium]|nr:GAF domain-containing protein [Thermoanaerobaculia bacterium]